MAKQREVPRIRGTYHLSMAGFEVDETRALIQRRRLQVLVHSCIYYRLDGSLVSDRQWQAWADELVKLQKQYPKIAERVDYHGAFKNFDASTGFDLPITNPEIMRKAQQLLEYSKGGGVNIGGAQTVRIEFPGVRRKDKKQKCKRVH